MSVFFLFVGKGSFRVESGQDPRVTHTSTVHSAVTKLQMLLIQIGLSHYNALLSYKPIKITQWLLRYCSLEKISKYLLALKCVLPFSVFILNINLLLSWNSIIIHLITFVHSSLNLLSQPLIRIKINI